MNHAILHAIRRAARGSVLVIVLWIAFGLVSMALYFADSMSSELRASDNRVCGLAADQAIEGAARYVSYVLSAFRDQRRRAGSHRIPGGSGAGRRRAFLDHRPRPVRHAFDGAVFRA